MTGFVRSAMGRLYTGMRWRVKKTGKFYRRKLSGFSAARWIFDPGDYRRTIFLAGSGRSGTTWLSEIITGHKRFRYMFEPFCQQQTGFLPGWENPQYLRPGTLCEQYLAPAAAILSGDVRCEWVDRFNTCFFPRRRLVKEIRTQLLLKWMKQHFPEIPVVLILRHPCAVAHSRGKMGWNSEPHRLLAQQELMEDYLEPFRTELQAGEDPFDKQILMWCVENLIPLKQFREGEILVVFYEDFCRTPEREIKKVMSFIGEKPCHAMWQLSHKPSALSKPWSAVHSRERLVDSWRKGVSDEQVDRAFSILHRFGLDGLYDKTGLPRLSGEEALQLFPSSPKATVPAASGRGRADNSGECSDG